ncbi:prephenate/arogenate dehydrogenase [Geitlerinema sp. PCC 7407]|uniref:prephenate/arogenate dehydrogenase n=1 Tax=Geitlerinema sp. PCC 7407 TaxID=1173025 RepID=UPI00029FD034|nr:prephenate/arogenate dehydrogenase [Geitlerinema sp. PCC 7407]AFY64599.1 arogenate dehydrogenase (NADP) [Geitlerinema sp. PCC 7407]
MKVGIVGLGLIGGSLGLDLRALGHWVVGSSRRPETGDRALELGVVDEASPDLAIMAQAEVVFLCTPIEAIAPAVAALRPHLRPETILTDVGSVKAPIVEAIAPLWPNFIGGHPMAGTEFSGVEAAQRRLFEGRPYVLTPTATTPPTACETVAAIARSLQAEVYECAPDIHDRAVAWISHLPVMVSGSLIAACEGERDPLVHKMAQCFASSGFRDTSRVGGGNPELGLMMARYNQAALVRSLRAYRDRLDQVIHLIEDEQWDALHEQLQAQQQARPAYLK